MTNMAVYQVELEAWAYYGAEITVALYSGETLSGQCKSHTVYGSRETLSCDRVAADRVRLTVSRTSETWLYVWDIRVTTKTIGL